MPSRPLSGQLRALIALTCCSAACAVAGTALADPVQGAVHPPIRVDLKVRVTNLQTHDVRTQATTYVVQSGEMTRDAVGHPPEFGCTPYLPDAPGRSTDWKSQQTRGVPIPVGNQILLDCALRFKGDVVQNPAVLAADGKMATLDVAESSYRYHVEVTASTDPKSVSAAGKQLPK